MSTLKEGSGEFAPGRFQKLVYEMTVRHIENGFNARHRYRRRFLEHKAHKHNLALMGAANKSECCMGWFVKDGVDDLPVSPLMELYKTQIRQMAAHLGVPKSIRRQTPSPDMIKGITDEIAMGILYYTLDRVLDGLDRGLDDDGIISMGISREEVELVREINRLSEWKREGYHVEPPVRGTVDGGLRLTQA